MKRGQMVDPESHSFRESFVDFLPADFMSSLQILQENLAFLIDNKEQSKDFVSDLTIIPLSLKTRKMMPWMENRQLSVFNSTFLTGKSDCSNLRGILVEPNSEPELTFLKGVLKKQQEKYLLLDLQWENSVLSYDSGRLLVNNSKTAVGFRKKRSTPITTVKPTADVEQIKTLFFDELSSLKAYNTETGVYESIEDPSKPIKLLCAVPSKASMIFGNSAQALAQKEGQLFHGLTQIQTELSNYVNSLISKGLTIAKDASKLTSPSAVALPAWFNQLSNLVFMIDQADGNLQELLSLSTLSKDLDKLLLDLIESSVLLSQDWLRLNNMNCEISGVPALKLKCILPDSSKKWIKVFLHLTSFDNKILTFTKYSFLEDSPSICGYEEPVSQQFFRMSQGCCEALFKNSKPEVHCPAYLLQNPESLTVFQDEHLVLYSPLFRELSNSCSQDDLITSPKRISTCDDTFDVNGQIIEVKNGGGRLLHFLSSFQDTEQAYSWMTKMFVISGSTLGSAVVMYLMWHFRKKWWPLCKSRDQQFRMTQEIKFEGAQMVPMRPPRLSRNQNGILAPDSFGFYPAP